jgi:hypothetical protein
MVSFDSFRRNNSVPEEIRKRVAVGKYRFTLHALERCIERNISPDEVRTCVLTGEIIENYPQDKYGPSCLICGISEKGKNLHVQCSLDPVWIITAYDPRLSPEEWEIDFKTRRKKP